MNRPQSKTDSTLKDAGSRFRSAEAAAHPHPLAEETFSMSRTHKFIKPVPFNGLLTNKLLTALPGEDFARLLPHLEPVSLSCGDDIYGFEEGIDEIYFPENAVISHLYILEDGSTTESALIGKEGMTGLSAIFASPAPTHFTQVIISGTALRMSAEILKQEFERGGAIQRLLLAYTSTRIAQLSQRAVCNGRHAVRERLCNWLLMIHDRVGDDQFALTHEQIARHLGTRRAGISEAATSLRDKQVITYSRGQMRIVDRQALEMFACECYPTLCQQTLTALQL